MSLTRPVFVLLAGAAVLALSVPQPEGIAASEVPCAPRIRPAKRAAASTKAATALLAPPPSERRTGVSETAGGPPVSSDPLEIRGTAHAYFESLSVRPECTAAYSLRNHDQLRLYSRNPNLPLDVTYDPENDQHPRRQDGAKIVIPANSASLRNQVRLPIPPHAGQSLVVTWESWLGREWDPKRTGIWDNKMFQLASPARRIFTEIKSNFRQGTRAGGLAKVNVRVYAEIGQQLGRNVTSKNPLSPAAGEFVVMQDKWSRYWAFFNPVEDGWYAFSLAVADADRGPVRVIDRIRIKPRAAGWESFWLEYNTSGSASPVERVAYARNVVMLRGLKDLNAILERPVP